MLRDTPSALEVFGRLVLSTTGAVQVVNGAGEELGEKGFFRFILHCSSQPTLAMLDGLKQALEAHAAGTPFPNDISTVAISREA